MDSLDTLKLLSSQMTFEPDGEPRINSDTPTCFSPKERDHAFTHPAQLPNGQKIVLLKTLLSSACERDCFYCPFRAGRSKMNRITFTPDEMAKSYSILEKPGHVQGLFLS